MRFSAEANHKDKLTPSKLDKGDYSVGSLGAIAQTLFKSWFIDFNTVRAKATYAQCKQTTLLLHHPCRRIREGKMIST